MLWIIALTAVAADRRTPIVEAVERATPSVVALEVDIPSNSPFPIFGGRELASSQGSGVVIDSSGIVLTNAHVIAGAARIQAHTLDNRTFEAVPIALDAELDLAVLRLEDAEGLVPIQISEASEPMLGETAIAIGNPYGLGLTVSTGVVSSIERQVEIQSGVYQSYIQTDAAINPGNSGGALVDLEGNLIGINTAIRAEAEGIGFAIPARRAKKIADDLLLYGSVRAPWLGCDFDDIHPRRLLGTGLNRGALRVTSVHPNGPCAKAGLAAGDIVFQIDGRQMASRADLNAWLADKRPGDSVVVEAVHKDAVQAMEVVSTGLPKNAGARAQETLGIEVRSVEGAVTVESATPGGSWSQAQLRAGDFLLAVDGIRIRSSADLLTSLRQAKARHQPTALFTVQRGRTRGHVTLRI